MESLLEGSEEAHIPGLPSVDCAIVVELICLVDRDPPLIMLIREFIGLIGACVNCLGEIVAVIRGVSARALHRSNVLPACIENSVIPLVPSAISGDGENIVEVPVLTVVERRGPNVRLGCIWYHPLSGNIGINSSRLITKCLKDLETPGVFLSGDYVS